MDEFEFDPKDPQEDLLLGFDYAVWLSPGETITAAAVDVTLLSGTDANPDAMVTGAALVVSPVVTQMIEAGVNGATYRVACLATTSLGQRFVLAGKLAVHTLYGG